MRNGQRAKSQTNGAPDATVFQSNAAMLLIVLVAVIAFFSVMNRNYFSYTNMTNILLGSSTVGLLAIGETYLIIAGHIDLSCAHAAALFGVWTALLINGGMPWGLTILFVLVFSSAVGLANAGLVNIFGLQPFIATLAISEVCEGVGFLICNGQSVLINKGSFVVLGSMKLLGISFPAWVLIILFLVCGFILAKTLFGRSVYMIGGNQTAAHLAGLNPKRISTILYVMSSMIAAVAGVLMAAKMQSGQPASATGAEFDAITAAILGGVAFTGGKGNLLGCFIGLLIIECFGNGLTVLNVSSFWQMVAKGLLLIAALIVDYVRRKRLDT